MCVLHTRCVALMVHPVSKFSLMLRSGLCVAERALSGMFGMGSEGGWADVNCGSSSTGSKMICNGGGLQERWAVGGELEEHFWAGSPSSCQLFGITPAGLGQNGRNQDLCGPLQCDSDAW